MCLSGATEAQTRVRIAAPPTVAPGKSGGKGLACTFPRTRSVASYTSAIFTPCSLSHTDRTGAQGEIWSDRRSGHGSGVEEGWVCGLGGIDKCFRARKLGFSEEYNPLCAPPSYFRGLDDEWRKAELWGKLKFSCQTLLSFFVPLFVLASHTLRLEWSKGRATLGR